MNTYTTLAIVDDHPLMRNGLLDAIKNFDNFKITIEASNGVDFIKQLDDNNVPDIVILDIKMPKMDGYETTAYLKEHYPSTKILIISVDEDEEAILKMVKLRVNGYILKYADPSELESTLNIIKTREYHYSEKVNDTIRKEFQNPSLKFEPVSSRFNDREITFLKLVCTEKTYKEIAFEMGETVKQIDKLRADMFEKCEAKCRVGLVLYAIKNKIEEIN